MLKFEDYTTILVTCDRKNGRFNFYEDEVKPVNICSFKPYINSKRLKEYKKGNSDFFKELFNDDGCLLGELDLDLLK